MQIQSLSIVVPNKACINNCKFCVSRMHCEDYGEPLEYGLSVNREKFRKRMEFARDNSCNTLMYTGTSEPQQNTGFIQAIRSINESLPSPFKCVEMQTTGTGWSPDALSIYASGIGVTTISLSLSSYDNKENQEINGTPVDKMVNIQEMCKAIRAHDINLRLSLNINDCFEKYDIFECAKQLGANQVTLRRLYVSEKDNPQSQWILEHTKVAPRIINEAQNEIKEHGRMLEYTEYGQPRYSYKDMSVVVDEDCMSVTPQKTLKYLILRPNGHLYTKWDDKASLLF